MKERMKKKSFWVAITAAIVLILQLLGIKIEAPFVNEVLGAVCAVCVFLGLITDDSGDANNEEKNEKTSGQNDEDDQIQVKAKRNKRKNLILSAE